MSAFHGHVWSLNQNAIYFIELNFINSEKVIKKKKLLMKLSIVLPPSSSDAIVFRSVHC